MIIYNLRLRVSVAALLTAGAGVVQGASIVAPVSVENHILLPTDGAAGDKFGISVAISGTTAIIGAPYDDDKGSESGAAYVFDVTTGAQLFKFTASDGAKSDYFGISVAISENIAIVGAPFDTDKGIYPSGSAYVFDVTTGAQLFKLTSSDDAPFARFGNSVAISGTTALVGASDGFGAAYLFDITTGTQLFKLTASDGAPYEKFGYSVALSESTAIVGAPTDDDNGRFSGSAYVFDVTTGAQLFKLTPSDAAAGDYFGISVTLSGTTALVGAPYGDEKGEGSGGAYVFDVTTGTQLSKLTTSDGTTGDFFGNSVALSGSTAVIGAPGDASKGFQTGAAYMFDMTTGGEVSKLVAHERALYDIFGYAVALSGTTAIVSAYGADLGARDRGAAFAYRTEALTPLPPVPLPAGAWLLISGLAALGLAQRFGRRSSNSLSRSS